MRQDQISITINGTEVQVAQGTSVAAAVMMAGEACRLSVRGEKRSALCGMGICMECRVSIDGVAHLRSCQLLCSRGMEVETQ